MAKARNYETYTKWDQILQLSGLELYSELLVKGRYGEEEIRKMIYYGNPQTVNYNPISKLEVMEDVAIVTLRLCEQNKSLTETIEALEEYVISGGKKVAIDIGDNPEGKFKSMLIPS